MQTLPNPHRKYYEGLDAWRGIAMLTIIFTHYFNDVTICRMGWISVDMFFVLSGFLITKILLVNKKGTRHFFGHFYARRVIRILPLYFVFLAAFYGAIFLFHKQEVLNFYIIHWKSYALFLQNWLFVLKGAPGEYYLNHLWSLSVEEQFYILWPLVIYFTPEKRLRTVLFSIIGAVCIYRSYVWMNHPHQFELYYFNTLTRIDSICMGCLLACSDERFFKHARLLVIVLGLVMIGGSIIVHDFEYTSPFFGTVGYTVLGFFYCFLLYCFIKSNWFNFIKKSRFLNYIGKISYCMYLVHVPVFLFMEYKVTDYTRALTWWVPVVSFGVTVGVSSLSWYLLEERVLRLKKYFPER